MQKLNNDNTWGILSMWYNWMLCYGALTLLILLSLWVRPLYLPFIAFAMQGGIFIMIRRNRTKTLPSCYILLFIVSRVLFWTGVVMVIINYLHMSGIAAHIFSDENLNPSIPFITVLITAPVTSLITGWGVWNRNKLSFCRDCRMRNGGPAERGFLGKLYTQEGNYQVATLFLIATLVTIASWVYYFVLYINVSLTPLDKFFYVWLRVILWIASSIYLALRYIGLLSYYKQNVQGSLLRHGRSTRLRYIIVCGDSVAVLPPESDPDRMIDLDERLDTPVQTYIDRRDNVSFYDAEQYLISMAHITAPVDLRFMYSNLVGNADCNIFHYLCFLTDKQRKEFEVANPRVIWLNLSEIAQAINTKIMSPLLSAEMVRLHTIGMAWKTYFPDGKRRYAIKHYRPTFRISEVKDWNIDYNNPQWIYVADNNEDTPFYHCRRFWRKYINGIGQ